MDAYDEQSGGPAGPPPQAAGRARGRRSFREWRRSRPFWGGLLLLVAGAELILIPLLSVLARGSVKVVIYIGIGGVFGVLIGGLLVACGLLIWFHPVQRMFYAIAGALLALVSFIATNLGGFFLGMLLGVIGASLSFGWQPGPRRDVALADGPEEPRGPEPGGPEEPSAGFGILPTGRHRQEDGEEAGYGEGSASRTLAIAAPLVLLSMLMPGHASAAAATAGSARPAAVSQPAGCIIPIPIICPSPSPTPTPTPSPTPTGSPAPTPSPDPSPSSGATPTPTPAGSPGSTKAAKSPKKASSVKADVVPGLMMSSAQFGMVTGTTSMLGTAYVGTANVPVAGGGTVQMMEFTMNSLTLTGNPTLTVTGNGRTDVTSGSSMTFTGNVVLYATQLSGSLLGIPITLTPNSPLSAILQFLNGVTPIIPLVLTNVTTDKPYISADSLQIPGLKVTQS